MRLLCHIGQVEVGGEGPHQLDSLGQVEPAEQLPQPSGVPRGRGGTELLGEGAHLLHQIEQRGSVLASQRLTELVPQPANIRPEERVLVDRLLLHRTLVCQVCGFAVPRHPGEPAALRAADRTRRHGAPGRCDPDPSR